MQGLRGIIKHFPNAYIEYSPSANEFHILMKYIGAYDKKNYYIKHDGIEVYSALSTTSYLTIIGNVYQKVFLAYEYLLIKSAPPKISLCLTFGVHFKGSDLSLSSAVSYLFFNTLPA